MEVNELEEDLLELYHDRETNWVPHIPFIWNPHSQIRWKLGPIFKERETFGEDSLNGTYITEVGATCVATQVEGPNPGVQGIAKIRMQIPDEDHPSSTKPLKAKCSGRAGFELYNLMQLTKLNCSCTPKLLDHVSARQSNKDPVPGGFIALTVMEKLPGRSMVNFEDLPMAERDEVRLAFAKAISEFYSYRFNHRDPDRRNLIWDAQNKKCYIIDLEDAYEINDAEKPCKFIPELDFYSWGVAGPIINTSIGGIDPMVPCNTEYIEDPGQEVLERWQVEAAGKELKFRTYDIKRQKPV